MVNTLKSLPDQPLNQALKLNLGCGARLLPDYINVDKYGQPDVQFDLETFPWPWADNSVIEIQLIHVLEHLGHYPPTYLQIMQEIYRICQNGAKIYIKVPHFRHDSFYSDPTHVRAITPVSLELFCQRLNQKWINEGLPYSTLGLNLDVNFELIETIYKPSYWWFKLYAEQANDQELFFQQSAIYNNLIEEISMTLEVVK